MVGVTLSRWTMTYFASALAALIVAEGLMAAGYGYPAVPIEAPETLVLVHVVAIGWLSLLMCGALFQFVPVLVARPLHSNSLPLPTLGFLLTGLAALLLGFLELTGHAMRGVGFFPIAGSPSRRGVWSRVYGISVAPCGLHALCPSPPASSSSVSFASSRRPTFGVIFALVLGGTSAYPHFFDVTAVGIPLHVIAGLGGWLTFTAMGVSYRLLAMFLLAPELEG